MALHEPVPGAIIIAWIALASPAGLVANAVIAGGRSQRLGVTTALSGEDLEEPWEPGQPHSPDRSDRQN
jgi:hypothetical protein